MKLIKIIMLCHVSFQSGTGQQAQHVAPVVGPWDDQKKCEIQKTLQKLTSSGKKTCTYHYDCPPAINYAAN